MVDLSNGCVLLYHLGMSGRLGMSPAARPAKRHDHVVLSLDDGRELRFNDARRFGMVACFAASTEAHHPRLCHLGVEPLDPEAFTGAGLYASTRGLHKPIKNYLMDATRQVGVGNIYACEALYAARIHPQRAAGRLGAARCDCLVAAVRQTLLDAINLGGTTLRDFSNGDGDAGYFGQRLQVYGRTGQPCVGCGHAIKRFVQAGRSTFYCGRCQR